VTPPTTASTDLVASLATATTCIGVKNEPDSSKLNGGRTSHSGENNGAGCEDTGGGRGTKAEARPATPGDGGLPGAPQAPASFPCLNDITSKTSGQRPFLATIVEGTGEAVVVFMPPPTGEPHEKVYVDHSTGEIRNEPTELDLFNRTTERLSQKFALLAVPTVRRPIGSR
jgi:hypothetical protein